MPTSPDFISPGTPRSLLVAWANQQDAWIRELVSDVIVTGKAISPEHVEELYDMLLRENSCAAADQSP